MRREVYAQESEGRAFERQRKECVYEFIAFQSSHEEYQRLCTAPKEGNVETGRRARVFHHGRDPAVRWFRGHLG